MPAKHEWPFIIVANRLPVVRGKGKSEGTWRRSPGGLVSALTPIVQNSGGAWAGWTGTTGPAPDPFVHDKITHLPVPISRTQLSSFYDGFCNGTIWPLYHGAVREPNYHRRWWRPYVTVNRRFAEITAKSAAPDASVWVHDYHLQLVPALLREMRPDLRIGFFLHIPFPPEELFGRLPWRRQILEGLLGADVVGFQTQGDAQNFLRMAKRYTEARIEGGWLHIHGHMVDVGSFPVSTDFEHYNEMASEPQVVKRSLQLHQQVGQGRKIILGVDRLDYTKGIDVRLRAFQELLARRPDAVRECVFVQLAVPSRGRVGEYRELRKHVEELVGQINGEFGEVGLTPVQYLHRELPFDELIALYRSAEVMAVTPLADGMNLVAKEYVATRFDDTGVLILSEFAGAAEELKTALQVNPHDVDGLAETINMALSLPEKEATRRMSRMREVVSGHTVYDWADSFMQALSA
ncbi:MAG: trehalose-6-phosphate synthase [Gemmatimonadota bacterium]|nr:MAG: trehalose-6-phosphate synthase [Gemmatimonadota bacterium]